MDETQLTTMLETLDSIGIVKVTRSGECSDFSITVSFESLPGDQPQLEVRFCSYFCFHISLRHLQTWSIFATLWFT